DPNKLREIAADARQVLEANPMMRTVNVDLGERTPTLHFSLQQDRLQAVGLTSSAVSLQLQFLLKGVPIAELRMEDPIIRRRDRSPTITVRGDVAEGLQPPDVSAAVLKELGPVIGRLPAGYRIEEAGITEESRKASNAI